jgi:hypothetical protein
MQFINECLNKRKVSYFSLYSQHVKHFQTQVINLTEDKSLTKTRSHGFWMLTADCMKGEVVHVGYIRPQVWSPKLRISMYIRNSRLQWLDDEFPDIHSGSYRPNVCLRFRIQEWNIDGTDLTKTYKSICNFFTKNGVYKGEGKYNFHLCSVFTGFFMGRVFHFVLVTIDGVLDNWIY